MESKYAFHMMLVGANPATEKLLETIPDIGNESVWADEYDISEGENEDGKRIVHAHIPLHEEAEAATIFDNLRGGRGLINSADSGHMNVHECPTRGGPEAWDCDERIIREIEIE